MLLCHSVVDCFCQWKIYTNAGYVMHTKAGLARSPKLQMFQLSQSDRSFLFLLQCLQSKPHLKHFGKHSSKVIQSVFKNILKIMNFNHHFTQKCVILCLTPNNKTQIVTPRSCHPRTPKNTNLIITQKHLELWQPPTFRINCAAFTYLMRQYFCD